ncbi:MAG: hypothetical protein QOD92_1050 [Acidimicrobiaceae bacterium]|jgi:hypothetical protein
MVGVDPTNLTSVAVEARGDLLAHAERELDGLFKRLKVDERMPKPTEFKAAAALASLLPTAAGDAVRLRLMNLLWATTRFLGHEGFPSITIEDAGAWADTWLELTRRDADLWALLAEADEDARRRGSIGNNDE